VKRGIEQSRVWVKEKPDLYLSARRMKKFPGKSVCNFESGWRSCAGGGRSSSTCVVGCPLGQEKGRYQGQSKREPKTAANNHEAEIVESIKSLDEEWTQRRRCQRTGERSAKTQDIAGRGSTVEDNDGWLQLTPLLLPGAAEIYKGKKRKKLSGRSKAGIEWQEVSFPS